MRKLQVSAMAALLAFGLASCMTENGNTPDNPDVTGKGAYVAVNISTPTGAKTRNSTEEGALPEERAIEKLFILTFNGNTLELVPIEGSNGLTKQFIELDMTLPENADNNPHVDTIGVNAQLISAAATHIVAIANPGAKLEARIRAMGNGATYGNFNAAITAADITVEEVTGMVEAAAPIANSSFTMISTTNPAAADLGASVVGDDVADAVATPLIPIAGHIVLVTGTVDAAAARASALNNPVKALVERLSVKLELTADSDVDIDKPEDSEFRFGNWTLDAVNTTFFPYASKFLRASHMPSSPYVYNYNFYTQDPNFVDVTPPAYHAGLAYGTVAKDAATGWAPVLPWTTVANPEGYYKWLDVSTDDDPVYAYAVENTMAAAAQRFGNATRVVIRATYYPAIIANAPDFELGDDWFMYNSNENDPNLVFSNIEDLQAAYAKQTNPPVYDNPNLRAACDQFFTQIQTYCTTMGVTGVPANFAGLTETFLESINDGGEVAKVPAEPEELAGVGIRWFQNGQNYYYYEIRHDNTVSANMAFSKYGVVRNNWYTMHLNKVSGAGTPWYPDLTDPGDGDPDPDVEIDKEVGYIGIDIIPTPWISWTTGFGI